MKYAIVWGLEDSSGNTLYSKPQARPIKLTAEVPKDAASSWFAQVYYDGRLLLEQKLTADYLRSGIIEFELTDFGEVIRVLPGGPQSTVPGSSSE